MNVWGVLRWMSWQALGMALVLCPVSEVRAADTSAVPATPDLALRLRACAACHGKEGRAAPDGFYPRIAGKPAAYLYNQLRNFRDGRRHNGSMVYLVEQLSDDYLREIATYFAELDLPYPAAPAPQATPAVLAWGAHLVREGDPSRKIPACSACHGQRLTGTLPAIPGLLGLPRSYLSSQIGAWQSHVRAAQAPDCMGEVAHRLTPSDVAAVSAWLAAQPLPSDTRPAAAAPGRLPLDCGSSAQP